jgi:hypothetical protein
MLTRNKKSKFNSQANLKGIHNLEILREGKGPDGKGKSTVFVEDEHGEKVLGAYFIICDKYVKTQNCFHLVSGISLIEYYRLSPGYSRMGLRSLKR